MKKTISLAIFMSGATALFLCYIGMVFRSSDLPRYRHKKDISCPTESPKANDIVEIGHLSKSLDPSCLICNKQVEGKYHVVTTFYPVTHPKWRGSVTGGQEKNADQQLAERVTELVEVLQQNLNNDLVIAVHVLADHPYSIYHLMKAPLMKKEKLVYHLFNAEISFAMGFGYIQDYLLNTAVIWLNQDIVLGEGLEKINITRIKSKKIAYVLSRRGRKEKLCTMPDSCGYNDPYMLSHDTYIFVLTKRFSSTELKQLDFKLDNLGGENVLIYFLEKTGNYKVLNPCRTVYTYHVHCRQFHSKERPQLNLEGRRGEAGFTDQLE